MPFDGRRLVHGGFGPVVSLSSIRRLADRSPLRSLGSTTRRNSGASVGSVVKAQIVREFTCNPS